MQPDNYTEREAAVSMINEFKHDLYSEAVRFMLEDRRTKGQASIPTEVVNRYRDRVDQIVFLKGINTQELRAELEKWSLGYEKGAQEGIRIFLNHIFIPQGMGKEL